MKEEEMRLGMKLDTLINWAQKMSQSFVSLSDKFDKLIDSLSQTTKDVVEREHELSMIRSNENHLRDLEDGLSYNIFKEVVVNSIKHSTTAYIDYEVLAIQSHEAAKEYMKLKKGEDDE